MSYQVLARKWRPRVFSEMVGQAHVVRALVNALDSDRVHHAFLFTGTRGVGKTTVARILAKCLNCMQGVSSQPCGQCTACREIDEGRFVDLMEVDAASRTKVEDTRELLENVPYAPAGGRYKVYLIDEVHMLSTHSFNALLKTLEEPPPHVKFLLATTDPHRLPVTILSRCLQFNLKRLSVPEIADHLARITREERVTAETPALRLLGVAADGSIRDGLSLLDQAIAYGNGSLQQDDVRSMLGSIDKERVYKLIEALSAGDAPMVMAQVADSAEQVPDFDSVLAEVITVLQRLAMAQLVPEAVDDESGDRARVLALAERMSPEDVQLYYQIGLAGRRDLPLAPDPRGGFEMVMLRMLAFRPGGVNPTRTQSDARAADSSKTGREVSSATTSPGSQDWSRTVAALGVSGLTKELALNCTLVEEQGDTVRLLLSSDHAQVLSKMREQQLQEALQKHYGTSVRLQIEVGEPGSETPATRQKRHQAEQLAAAVESIEADPNVRTLQETFDATVVEGSVRPVQ